MNVLDSVKALNQRAAREHWYHVCDPSLTFTEPSYEVDIKTSALGTGDRWLEIAGCGLVDPAVFDAVNAKRGDRAFDTEKYTGFAFGFGLDRLAMILSGVPDIRYFTDNDQRFLAQFS